MTTNNNERIYHLTDKEGFLLRSTVNTKILDHNGSSIFEGTKKGEGFSINGGKGWITSYELSNFFKDVTPLLHLNQKAQLHHHRRPSQAL